MNQIAPTVPYLIAAIAISGAITFALRALPFAVLKKLRKSRYVQKLGVWMPVGIMLILAVGTISSTLQSRADKWWALVIALVVTVGAHYLTKRNTTLSVVAGTACYVALVNLVG